METRYTSGPLMWLARGRTVFYVLGAIVVTATLGVIGVTLMGGVVVRYVLNGSLAWSSELPVILFPWLIMGGIVMAAARHRHLGVDFFLRQVPAPAARAIAVLMQLLIALLMASLIHQSATVLTYLQYQTTPVLGWSARWAFYSMPTGAAGVLVLALIDLVGLLSGREPVIEELSP